jgi:hypothetical protein
MGCKLEMDQKTVNYRRHKPSKDKVKEQEQK